MSTYVRPSAHEPPTKRQRTVIDDDRHIIYEEDYQDEFDDNFYGDEADRERLRQMTEVERENIIFNRYQQRLQNQKIIELARKEGRLRSHRDHHQHVETSSTRQSSITTTTTSNQAVEDVLLEIEQNRKLKSASISSSKAPPPPPPSKTSSTSTTTSSRSHNNKKAIGQQPPIEWMQDVRISRSQILKHINEPYFDDLVTGAYVRFFIGDRNNSIYRLALVTGVQPSKPYEVDGFNNTKIRVQKSLQIQICGIIKPKPISYVSNSPFSKSEYKFWVDYIQKKGATFPSKSDLQKKALQLKNSPTNYVYSDEDIKNMINSKTINYSALPLDSLRRRLNGVKEDLTYEEDEEKREELNKLYTTIQREIQIKEQLLKKQETVSIDEINQKTMEYNRVLDEISRTNQTRTSTETSSYDPFARISSESSFFGAVKRKKPEKKVVEEKKNTEIQSIADVHGDVDLDFEIDDLPTPSKLPTSSNINPISDTTMGVSSARATSLSEYNKRKRQ